MSSRDYMSGSSDTWSASSDDELVAELRRFRVLDSEKLYVTLPETINVYEPESLDKKKQSKMSTSDKKENLMTAVSDFFNKMNTPDLPNPKSENEREREDADAAKASDKTEERLDEACLYKADSSFPVTRGTRVAEFSPSEPYNKTFYEELVSRKELQLSSKKEPQAHGHEEEEMMSLQRYAEQEGSEGRRFAGRTRRRKRKNSDYECRHFDCMKRKRGDPYSDQRCKSCMMLQFTNKLVKCERGHLMCEDCLNYLVRRTILSNRTVSKLYCPHEADWCSMNLHQVKGLICPLVFETLLERLQDGTPDFVKCIYCGLHQTVAASDASFICRKCLKINAKAIRKLCIEDKRDSVYSPSLLRFAENLPDMECHLPSNWSPMSTNPENYLEVPLEVWSEEWEHVSKMFLSTLDSTEYTIKRISRIQHPQLWQRYCLKRQHMIAAHGRAVINEMFLFHGTAMENVKSICKEGFDFRLASSNGYKHGRGCYFAKKSSVSLRYSLSPKGTGLPNFLSGLGLPPHLDPSANWLPLSTSGSLHGAGQTASHWTLHRGVPVSMSQPVKMGAEREKKEEYSMFVARVLCGRTTVGFRNTLKPPVDPADPRELPFDSTCDVQRDPSMFVIYDLAQAYPDYVVIFGKNE